MSRVCAVTGRRTRVGNQVKRRGLAKKLGGVGSRVLGRSKRKFKPNLQPIRVLTPEGKLMRLRVSTRVIKRGVITLKVGERTVSFPLVKAARGRNRAFSKAQSATGQTSKSQSSKSQSKAPAGKARAAKAKKP